MKKTKLCLLGGGHGLSTVLLAMKEYSYLSAIVAVTDSGGSTGKIRNKFDCPAIGDIRRCLNSLADKQLKDIFERRIKDYGDCVGNLIIASLIKLYDFPTAIKIMHKLLGLSDNHRVLPVSLDNFDICGEYKNNKIIKKETDFNNIEKIEKVWLEPVPSANPEALESIIDADYIIIAPGSFFTSILANFLVPEICKEINKKKIIWIANAMQQFGETVGMDINDHANHLLKYINHIDFAIVNNIKPDEEILSKHYESYLMPLYGLNNNFNIENIVETDMIKYNENGIVHSPFKINKALRKIIDNK
jgi:uncharacterized cofD-like protein